MPPSPLPERMLSKLDEVYQSRWEALMSVDEMVADVVGALETNALLENTYLIYTSDNGYHMGKIFFYEFSFLGSCHLFLIK